MYIWGLIILNQHVVFNKNTNNLILLYRYNKNGVDLNRNFPDAFDGNNQPRQKEVTAIMNWLNTETFVLSANLHGGAVVASYPYDNSNSGQLLTYGH